MPDSADIWKWPDFKEPELHARMRLDESAFFDLWVEMAGKFPPREFNEEAFLIGSGYPWPRPDGSFVLAEGEGLLLADLPPARREELIAELSGPGSLRTPMLAIGSNGSPEGLWRKFAHFEDPADRTLLAVSGQLHDFDVGPSAELALYGAMPATIFPSPGTRVRVTAVWLTDTQLKQLAWAEVPYLIGRLEARFDFEPEMTGHGAGGFDRALVFVNRFGSFSPDGEMLSLAAVPAENRQTRALEQTELLGQVAELVFGGGMTARDLVRRAYEEPGDTGRLVAEAMRSNSIPFESDRWTPLPL